MVFTESLALPGRRSWGDCYSWSQSVPVNSSYHHWRQTSPPLLPNPLRTLRVQRRAASRRLGEHKWHVKPPGQHVIYVGSSIYFANIYCLELINSAVNIMAVRTKHKADEISLNKTYHQCITRGVLLRYGQSELHVYYVMPNVWHQMNPPMCWEGEGWR